MSYPAPVYLGDGGEVTAWLRPVDTPPELPLARGAAHFLATGASTAGRFGLYRWDMDAEAGGAQPHFHRTISESFFVLSGAVELFQGERWVQSHAGDFVHVPEGGLHGFRNVSPEPASMLIHFAPGAPREAYFRGLADLAEGRWQPSHEELVAFMEEHDNFYV